MNLSQLQLRAKELIRIQCEALSNFTFDDSLQKALETIVEDRSTIITTGIGKAGYIARKSASTFCTTGSPAVYLHPGDASHGDIGLLKQGDAVIAFSNSGKNREVLETVQFARTLGAKTIISITANRESPLAELSDCVIPLGSLTEACPLGFTPTTSTTLMLVVADTLAVLVMEARGFSQEDFAIRHHGGYLGRKSRREC